MNTQDHNSSKRKFIKKLAYIPPAVITLNTVPSYANTGSPRQKYHDDGGKYRGHRRHHRHR